MSVGTHLVVADCTRREWLKGVLSLDPDFVIVSEEPDVFRDPVVAQLYAVDLTHPYAVLPKLWGGTHLFNPRAGRMALLDPAVADNGVLEAALHGGAVIVAWNERPEQVLRIARVAAGLEACSFPAETMTDAISRVFGNLDGEARDAHLDRLCVDLTTRRVLLDHRCIRLKPREFQVLSYLAQQAGRVVCRQELLQAVWHERRMSNASLQRVKTEVSRIRAQVEPDPDQPRYILSEYAYGYIIPADMVYVRA